MSTQDTAGSGRVEYPREFEDVDALETALDAEIESVRDEHLDVAETMAEYQLVTLEDAVAVHIKENATAEWLPPTTGSWGTRAVERWHDVVVDAIENIGRFHQRRNEADRPSADGHLVLEVPLEDNRGEFFATGGKR